MTNEQIAEGLIKGFIAVMAKTMLDNDPNFISESNLWQIVQLSEKDKRDIQEHVSMKIKLKLQDDLANCLEAFGNKTSVKE